MTGSSSRWLKIWLLWTLLGILTAIQTHYRYALIGRPFTWAQALMAEVGFVWIWALATPFVLWMAERFPIGKSGWRRNLLVHLCCAVALGFLTKAIWDASIYPLVHPEEARKMPRSFQNSVQMALMSLDYGFLQYGIVMVSQLASRYFRRSERDRLRASQLEAQLAVAQLQALKMQLHPHFLFNTLNTISELVHHDPRTAERMVIRLSDFLRLTLDHMGVPEVPLMVELDFLRRYLEIEQLRFEDRLRVHFDVEAASLHGRVPNLILQPIVENALKHGLPRRSGVGEIHIHSHTSDGRLALRIVDNGPGITEPSNGAPVREGVGIANTRRRLLQAYGSDHLFTMGNVTGGGFEVNIEIPLLLDR